MKALLFILYFVTSTMSLKFDGKFYDCQVFNRKVNLELSCSKILSKAKRSDCEALQNILLTAARLNKQFHSIETPFGMKHFYSESK
jgi:hypothetical protein